MPNSRKIFKMSIKYISTFSIPFRRDSKWRSCVSVADSLPRILGDDFSTLDKMQMLGKETPARQHFRDFFESTCPGLPDGFMSKIPIWVYLVRLGMENVVMYIF
jgi:hypothetical protein